MNENNELLLHLAKNAEMGVSSTTKLLNTLKNKENKIKPLLENELKESGVILLIVIVIRSWTIFSFLLYTW